MKKSLKDFTPMKLEEQQEVQGGDLDCNCGSGGKPPIKMFCPDDLVSCINQCIHYCA